ncbi:MAG: RelA/SpoT family protein [Paludibacteraceae bacterium]|nr:RelA/SpoT family protein [Paludibacteraceae bacterium]
MNKEERLKLEEEQINKAFYSLVDDYMASRHSKKKDVIIKAFNFAKKAHEGIRRISGEPYIYHPLAVAQVCCKEIGLGSTSICAALLHDVTEDTDYTIDDITNIFGESVGRIVEGMEKISGGIFGEKAQEQSENMSKLVISMSEDIRVILIKIADRLVNMRELDKESTNKQLKIAEETEFIYAPLAHRLGLFSIKTELEDLCFKYNFPIEYKFIQEKLDKERDKRIELYNKFKEPITTRLEEIGINFDMKMRIKSPYSIYKKMQAKKITIDEVYDILGSRIVFEPADGADEKLECWKIYNTITEIYKPHPNRTRDWLSNPKQSGYEALHVTVMGPEGYWIEVQIRTHRMDDIAEKGLAAHWNYKQDYSTSENKIEEWLNTVNELLKNPDTDAMHFLESFKISEHESEFYVFTPKGEIKSVSAGATALDFAFLIHSDIGYHAIGAKVNNKLVPLNYELHSGDQVEILTAEKQAPKEEWLKYVTTARAKDKIIFALKKSGAIKSENSSKGVKSSLMKLVPWIGSGNKNNAEQPLFATQFDIRGIDRKKMVHDIVRTISEANDANIEKITFETTDGVFQMNVSIYVSQTSDLQKLYYNLQKIEGITSVSSIGAR